MTAERLGIRARRLGVALAASALLVATAAGCGSSSPQTTNDVCTPQFPRPTGERIAGAATPRRPLALRPDGTIDPTKIDLGGVPGVTPAEQHRAENLLRRTVLELPKWKDVRTAQRAGYISLGDAARCWEHYVNVRYILNNDILDPKQPESLVYRVGPHNSRILEAAMYELAPHTTLLNAPDLGGKLTQWHIHNTLCFKPNSFQGVGQNADGTCPTGFRKPVEVVPMIHVWIVPKPCGPFAALDDILGGETPGSTEACDNVHGSDT